MANWRSDRVVFYIIFFGLLVGCQRAPVPESSIGLNYAWRTTIPVDTNVYTLRGVVDNESRA